MQANLRRAQWRSVQTVSKNFVPKAFLQGFLEEANRALLRMPGEELYGEAACRKRLSILALVAEERPSFSDKACDQPSAVRDAATAARKGGSK
jgi:hypothetical protein